MLDEGCESGGERCAGRGRQRNGRATSRLRRLAIRAWKACLAFLVVLLSACAHLTPDEYRVYEAVIARAANAGHIDGMDLLAWLEPDPLSGCDEETRERLAAVPSVTAELIESYCSRSRRSHSLPERERRALARAIPRRAEEPTGDLRDLRFSAIGFDEPNRLALVFVVRQVALECDVGEYFVLRREDDGWRVLEEIFWWIS